MTGPFEFKDVAVSTWAHNAAPVQLKDQSYAIFHIGDGTGLPDGGDNCTTDVAAPSELFGPSHSSIGEAVLGPTTSKSQLADPRATGSTIHVSKSLDGPWEPLSNSLGGCNNPAPWVHPNGTVFILCGNTMLRTDNISGPWTAVSSLSHSGGPSGNYEDPFLYTDSKGHFHLLYHVYTMNPAFQCVNSTVSAHAFSEDGFTWTLNPEQPYSTQVQLASGQHVTVATRERPKLVFDVSGQPTHLINGVCGATACGPTQCVQCKYNAWDYTLVVPLAV